MDDDNKHETENDSKLTRIKSLVDKLKIGDWNLSHEREFMENLFVGRFNYYLLIFSIFTTAGFANTIINQKYVVFYFGTLLLLACWIPLFRGYKKHDMILKIIFQEKSNHPTNIIENIMGLYGFKHFFKISKWMGIYIPALCIIFLLVVGILLQFGIIQ